MKHETRVAVVAGIETDPTADAPAATAPPTETGPDVRSTRSPWLERLGTVSLAVGFILAAEIVARNDWVSNLILPAPSSVWAALVDGFGTGIYWLHIGSTMGAAVGGFLIGALIAITLAGILVSIPRLEAIVMPFIVALQGLPKIALAPLAILWLGFGIRGKIFVVILVCFFPILINTLQGLRIREREQFELTKSLGASRYQIVRYIRVPNAIPYIFAGFRIGILLALIGAIVGEFVGSRSGLGHFMIQQKALFNVPGVFAILVLLMLIGLSLYGTIVLIERKVAFWASEVGVLGAEA